jgi:hypothetical protein
VTVVELIEQLMGLPGDEQVYRWDSERSADGTETVAVTKVRIEELWVGVGETLASRVVIS